MWYERLKRSADALARLPHSVHSSAKIEDTAVLLGNVAVGSDTVICRGAYIEGPVQIGKDCLIGDSVKIRGPVYIGDGTRIGYAAEIKNAVIDCGVTIGPMCYVADSVVNDDAYLGAMVRTSNHRLDRQTVKVIHDGHMYDSGMEKLGAHIGARASLGIQVIILPGRVIASHSIFGPRITIEKNLPAGRYTLKQELRVSVV